MCSNVAGPQCFDPACRPYSAAAAVAAASPDVQGSAAAALFSVWNNGQYGSTEKTGTPNNQQDDITILSNTAAHGLPRLPDEAGDSETNAAALCTAIGTCSASAATAGYVRATANAVINSGTDKDYFSFTANAAGSITIRIDYTPPWGQEIFQDAGPYGTFSYSVPFPRSDLRLDLGFPAGSLFSDVVKPQSSIVDASQTFMATVPAAGERARVDPCYEGSGCSASSGGRLCMRCS